MPNSTQDTDSMTAPFDWAEAFHPTGLHVAERAYLRARIEAAFVPVETYEAEGLRMAQTMLRMTNALEARAEAAEARNKVLEEALRWYQEQVSNCNRMSDDTARNELARDLGQRAAQALGGEHER